MAIVLHHHRNSRAPLVARSLSSDSAIDAPSAARIRVRVGGKWGERDGRRDEPLGDLCLQCDREGHAPEAPGAAALGDGAHPLEQQRRGDVEGEVAEHVDRRELALERLALERRHHRSRGRGWCADWGSRQVIDGFGRVGGGTSRVRRGKRWAYACACGLNRRRRLEPRISYIQRVQFRVWRGRWKNRSPGPRGWCWEEGAHVEFKDIRTVNVHLDAGMRSSILNQFQCGKEAAINFDHW